MVIVYEKWLFCHKVRVKYDSYCHKVRVKIDTIFKKCRIIVYYFALSLCRLCII